MNKRQQNLYDSIIERINWIHQVYNNEFIGVSHILAWERRTIELLDTLIETYEKREDYDR